MNMMNRPMPRTCRSKFTRMERIGPYASAAFIQTIDHSAPARRLTALYRSVATRVPGTGFVWLPQSARKSAMRVTDPIAV
jgi:hypothetical protein